MRRCFVSILLGAVSLAAHAQSAPLTLTQTFPLSGVAGKFDHFAFDPAANRLFIAATGNHSVEVLDTTTGKTIESIKGLGKPHGLAWVEETGRLFVADGTLASLNVYQGSPLKLVSTIKLSEDADDMVYDPATKLLYVGHGGGSAAIPGRVAVVDAAALKLVANLPTKTHPEALEIDPAGHRIFVNVADSAEVVVIDGTNHTISQTWPLTRAKDNVPLAFDGDSGTLILGCRTPAKALVLDAKSGHELNNADSSAGADDLFYEPSTHHVYLVAGSGSVDSYELTPEKTLKSLGSIQTASGAKTALLVPSLHDLFVGVPGAAGKPSEIRVYSTAQSK